MSLLIKEPNTSSTELKNFEVTLNIFRTTTEVNLSTILRYIQKSLHIITTSTKIKSLNSSQNCIWIMFRPKNLSMPIKFAQ